MEHSLLRGEPLHMRNQACEPCAKRKVRCDREEPCSTCKRRKQNRCTYPELSPADRIRKLEALVRSLGGIPDSDSTLTSLAQSTACSAPSPVSRGPASSHDSRSKDPVILEEDGQQYYLESRAWLVHGHRQSGNATANAKNPLLLRSAPHAFQSIICSGHPSDLTAANSLQNNAQTLWTIFKKRVHPLFRVSFSRDLGRLESATFLPASSMHITDAEDALVSSIYLASIVSLSNAECETIFLQSKPSLLSKYQTFCEEAIARTNILCMKNVIALKAMAIYLIVSIDRLSTQSLWTLMGLAIRNGETLGIHRDGTFLGLSPYETEDRRRLWWQLQYLDLILAIRLGATPLTLMADWDVKLPLNIEDDDLTPDMKSFPEERKGLTSMSYCLFTFYVLEKQRQYHADKGQFELCWSTNQSVPMKTKETFIDQLEYDLNQTFLQYCDPIKPLDTLLQLIARALIGVFRQRILLTVGEYSGLMEHEHRGPLLKASMQLLEYAVIMHSHRLLKDFQWLTTNGFTWPAFMVVLVEASHERDVDKCQRIWSLLSDLYEANTSLLELAADRRRLHAAELIAAAWKTCQSNGTVGQSLQKPDFVTTLDIRLAECRVKSVQRSSEEEKYEENAGAATESKSLPSLPGEEDANALFELDFQGIDWSFWNSVD